MVFNDLFVSVLIYGPFFSSTYSLQSIQELSKSIYIPRGINTDALDRYIQWDFSPNSFKVGEFFVVSFILFLK